MTNNSNHNKLIRVFYLLLLIYSNYSNVIAQGYGGDAESPIFSNSIDQNPKYPLDKIENIDASSTQLIISTTKSGPADYLHIHINITDLEENKKLTPIDLNGLWLTISRGRYTVSFLKPDRWYGIDYLIERGNEKYREQRLVKTLSANPALHNQDTSFYEVKIDRTSKGETSPEGVYVTMKWLQKHRAKNSKLVVKLRVHCDKETSENEIILPAEKDSQTVELQMDNKYELEDVDTKKHQVKARISPLKCHTVCWQGILRISPDNSANFEKSFDEECRNIDTITSTTFLRELKAFKIDERVAGSPQLVIVTEYSDNNDDAIVILSALPLDGDSSALIRKQFSTKNSSNEFRLPLEEDTSYAVQYEYIKIHPFHYSSKVQFLVETSAFNTSEPSQPIVQAEFRPNITSNENKEKPDYPSIVLGLREGLEHREVVVKIEPFCGDVPVKMVLNGKSPQREINMTDFVCSKAVKKRPNYCSPNSQYSTDISSDEKYTDDKDSECAKKGAEQFCYTTSVLIGDDKFPSPLQCINATEKFAYIINEARNFRLIFVYFATMSIISIVFWIL